MSDTGICPSCGTPLPADAPEGLCPPCLFRAGAASDVADARLTTSGGPGFAPPQPEQLAARFPQYEISALIGHGGMGAVYRALHRKLDRPVALSYAHRCGVVHRDIKPENVLLDNGDHVKIADFGLAKLLEYGAVETSLTATHQVMGTPHYMAPEQIESPGEVDQRADIYSLGVVFYEMLTGHLPLGRFEPPSQSAEVGEEVDRVVLKTLERQPHKRYQQASEVKGEVDGIGTAAPPAPKPAASRPEPEIPEVKRRSPKDGALLHLVVGGIAVFALGSMPWFGFRIADLAPFARATGSALRDFGTATSNAWESNINPFGIGIPTAIVPLIGILVVIGAVATQRAVYRIPWKVPLSMAVVAELVALTGLLLILQGGIPQIGLFLTILVLVDMGVAAFALRPVARPEPKPAPRRKRDRQLKGRRAREKRTGRANRHDTG